MGRVAYWIKGFGLFWYHFIIGDDWLLAASVVAGLIVTAVLRAARVDAWWVVPLLAIVMVGVSLRRTSRRVA
ncbi:MAG TPA: hypothetical protein VET65_14485 [Candidatus Limnocylindrales bacterium]|nr:hypothetical protein [Candidatus Limnocylindrales bacterium]